MRNRPSGGVSHLITYEGIERGCGSEGNVAEGWLQFPTAVHQGKPWKNLPQGLWQLVDLLRGRNELTSVVVDGPRLGVVEVRVAAVDGEVGVGQGSSGSVEGISVAVLAAFEPDVNVHVARLELVELEVGVVGPHVERSGQFLVHFAVLQTSRVLADAVRQVLHAPTAPCREEKRHRQVDDARV